MSIKKILLIIGCILILLGLSNKLSLIHVTPNNAIVDVMELAEPEDENIKKEALEIVSIFKNSGGEAKTDAKKLRDLYLDLAKLISLDNNDLVIKNTEEIRQANSVAGAMFRLDAKNKYPNLGKEAQDVVVGMIGDDQITLSSELRAKAVESFNVLAWACNEGSK